jgi:hypothetical protein
MFWQKLARDKSLICPLTIPIMMLLVYGSIIGSFLVGANAIHAASNDDQWNPPSNLAVPLDLTWQHDETTRSNLYSFMNYGWDQIMANKGTINYCVRWDSNAPVSATLRNQIHAALTRQFDKWIQQIVNNGKGWDGWPYTKVPLKVVGWAVRDRSLLQWTDNSVDIYVNDIYGGSPQCAEPCGRFFHRDNNYSGCPGGSLHHYDMSLWLTAGFEKIFVGIAGHGGDWGQRIGSESFVNAINAHTDNIGTLQHEMGHSFGLNDFYDWQPPGIKSFLMRGGTASQITEFDKWMFRNYWRHLKNRYKISETVPLATNVGVS